MGVLRKALAAATCAVLSALVLCPGAHAIDFYEIVIYPTDIVEQGHLMLELHSNSVTTASGKAAKEELDPYQIHETLEATYGILPFVEIGQYLCTARLNNGNYEYAGSRSKIHFALPWTLDWPVSFGANIELSYMRQAAESDPFSLDMMPIVQTHIGKFTAIGNFVFEKPFDGKGVGLDPSAEIAYDLFSWITPAIEYYGDMSLVRKMPAVQYQQHFIVPTINLNLIPGLEFNLGVGFGVTRSSNGTFVKGIIGWTF